MNSKLKLVLMTAALLTCIASSTRMAHPNAQPQPSAQTHAKKGTLSATAGSKASPTYDCSLLTPAMIKKVLGHPFQAGAPHKAMPMYGGAWGWSCHYFSLDQRNATVDFGVYAEASAAKAKQDFDTYSIAADDSRGKPSIGDSAYWVEPDTSKRALDSSKKTLLIFVLKGKVHFSIEMTPPNEKQLRDLAAAVAAGI